MKNKIVLTKALDMLTELNAAYADKNNAKRSTEDRELSEGIFIRYSALFVALNIPLIRINNEYSIITSEDTDVIISKENENKLRLLNRILETMLMMDDEEPTVYYTNKIIEDLVKEFKNNGLPIEFKDKKYWFKNTVHRTDMVKLEEIGEN